MSSRFTYFWKQLIPSELGSSDFDTPFEKASYRSIFLTGPLSEKSPLAQDEHLKPFRIKRASRRNESCCFEDIAG